MAPSRAHYIRRLWELARPPVAPSPPALPPLHRQENLAWMKSFRTPFAENSSRLRPSAQNHPRDSGFPEPPAKPFRWDIAYKGALIPVVYGPFLVATGRCPPFPSTQNDRDRLAKRNWAANPNPAEPDGELISLITPLRRLHRRIPPRTLYIGRACASSRGVPALVGNGCVDGVSPNDCGLLQRSKKHARSASAATSPRVSAVRNARAPTSRDSCGRPR